MRTPPPLVLGLTVGVLAGGPAPTAAGAGFTGGGLIRTPRNVSVEARVVSYAKKFTAVPYVFGANGPRSFDCSGYTSYVFRHFNIKLPRSSYAQMHQGHRVTSALRPGDPVFWEGDGHVGIYAGHISFISAAARRGIWTYSLTDWRQFQSYTTARRILPAPPRGVRVQRRLRSASVDRATADLGRPRPTGVRRAGATALARTKRVVTGVTRSRVPVAPLQRP